MRRGRFIVFEGLDGSGTTTQAARLAERLAAEGISAELTREPSNGPLGAVLRQAIEVRVQLDPTALALAFAADRADHLFHPEHGIVALLDQGRWVVSDRYVLSSLAYQAGEEVPQEWIEEINRFAIEPDLTLYLAARLDTCLERIAGRSSADELFHDREQLRRVERNYEALLPSHDVVPVDAEGSIDEVAERIWAIVGGRLLASRA